MQHIHSSTFAYREGQLTTFAVVLKADPCVYIYRFLWDEKKFYLHHTIHTNTLSPPLDNKDKPLDKKKDKDAPLEPPKLD